MNTLWSTLTLTQTTFQAWLTASWLHRGVGLLQGWRSTSWLFQWADGLVLGLLSLMMGLAPFVSTSLIGILLVACGGFWLLLTLTDPRGSDLNRPTWTPIHLPLCLYWGIASLAVAFSPEKSAAFVGWVKLSLSLLAFLLMARVLRSPAYRTWLITLVLFVALGVSIYGVRQYFFGADPLATWVDPDSSLAGSTRVYSYLGNPNLLAGYLIPGVGLSLSALLAWERWSLKALALTLILVNGACLILTYSRGGWIGLVLTSFVFGLFWVNGWRSRWPQFWRTWGLPLVLFAFTLLLIVGIATVEPLRDRVLSIFAGRADSSNNFRLNVWASVLDMIGDRPLWGIGPGNAVFNRIYPLYMRPNFSALSAYSVFLEITVEMGFLGLGAFLWLVLVTFSQACRSLQRVGLGDPSRFWLIGAIAVTAGMLGHGLVDTVWYRPQVNLLWWLMVALIASHLDPALDHGQDAAVED